MSLRKPPPALIAFKIKTDAAFRTISVALLTKEMAMESLREIEQLLVAGMNKKALEVTQEALAVARRAEE